MANYTKTVDFAAKDGLAAGAAAKRVLGSELNTEFNNIQSAIATKLDSSAFVTGTPIGTTVMWPTASPPTGWLLCNGQAVSRTAYATLFSLMSTTYGSGDGVNTFNLPNFTNRMPVGAGGLYALGATGGSKDAVVVSHTHTATVTETPHFHTAVADVWRGANAQQTGANWGGGDRRDATNVSRNTDTKTVGITVTNSTEGVNGTDQNMPPYLPINFIIKAVA